MVLDKGSYMPDGDPALTEREKEVLRLVAAGYTNAEIGLEIHRDLQTVKSHVKHLLRKVGVANRVELTRWFLQEGGGNSLTVKSLQRVIEMIRRIRAKYVHDVEPYDSFKHTLNRPWRHFVGVSDCRRIDDVGAPVGRSGVVSCQHLTQHRRYFTQTAGSPGEAVPFIQR